MKIFVIDASIVLNSLLDKNKKASEKFRTILEDNLLKTKIYSPGFLTLEVSNGLRFSTKDKKESISILEKYLNLPINFFSFTSAHILEILRLSYQTQTTVYDSSYHFLALILNGKFLTCDKDYYEKAKELGGVELV